MADFPDDADRVSILGCGRPDGGAANGAKRMLPGTKLGVKYYCADRNFEWDMKRRIVHIYDPQDTNARAEFYLLTHSDGPVRDNSYKMCQTIIY
jgi:hypothetical protein